MPELLLEVGCEELPASFVRKAYTDLLAHLTSLLAEAGVLEGEGSALGTPRRLIVSFPNLKERQEDTTKEQRGPALKAAYDDAGNPSQALLGFCRSQGIDPSELRNDGTYVWATKSVEGRPTAELLAELLPKAIRSLSFEKSMRWGSARMRFARPIRWILASFNGKTVPFEIEGVASGANSRGHRFYDPVEFPATTLQGLIEGLRQHKVEPDPEIRRTAILQEAARVASGKPDLTDALVDENVFLTEWPSAVEGAFREEFESLPEPVLVTAMAKHERFFPVRDPVGKLTNRFVSIRNAGVDEDVRQGNEWVLNARFNDAKFFFDEDAQQNLDYFLEKTSGIVFQETLGNVRQRADRLAHLAEAIAKASGADESEASLARKAGLYAKADLSTGLVSELASLQGIIGGEYATREAFEEPVCWAIATQYDLGKNRTPDSPSARSAVRLVMADQLDKLAGYLGLGLVPSGSSDPYGLRRAATLLIEAAWSWPTKLPSFDSLLREAVAAYAEQGVSLDGSLVITASSELFGSRYEALMPEVRYDVLEAALGCAGGPLCPQCIRFAAGAMEIAERDTAFVQTATRPLNIVSAARKKGIAFSADAPISQADSPDAEALDAANREVEAALNQAAATWNAEEAVRQLKRLEAPINGFFDSTMVMVEDETVRAARLAVLERTSRHLLTVGDFSRIVQEG